MKTKNIKNGVKEKIKKYFFENPTEKLRVRQIERKVRVPIPSVIKYVKELKEEGILISEEISGVRFFSADRISKRFLIEKKLFNIMKIYESGIFDYLVSEYLNPTIIVFGSFARGEDIEKSDIDIYIETSKKEKFELEKFEKASGRRIQIFNYSSIRKVENKELANNIVNGFLLNGFLEVFK